MTHNFVIYPKPTSPTRIPDLSQEFGFEYDNNYRSYRHKRPSNINTDLGSRSWLEMSSSSGSTSSSNYQHKRPIGTLTPIQENETKDKVMRRDRSLGFEEAKAYIRNLSFGPHSQ
jgi:hypothetical protein